MAKKFRDLGIGPFAPLVPNLGAPTGREEPHTVYGMSQMYGNQDYYGPYGLLKSLPEKCLCMTSETELAQNICDCVTKRSDLYPPKPVCGYGTCPLSEKSPEQVPCCMKNSKDSVFFVPGFVPKKKVHCKSSVCPCSRSQTSTDRCECIKENISPDHIPCGRKSCGMVKESCDCQTERSRGGQDKRSAHKIKTNICPKCKGCKEMKSQQLNICKMKILHNNDERKRAGEDLPSRYKENNCPNCGRSKSDLHSISRVNLVKRRKMARSGMESNISLRTVSPTQHPRLRAGMDNHCDCKGLNPKCVVTWRDNWVPSCFDRNKKTPSVDKNSHCDDKPEEVKCDGWDEEPLFFNKPMVQSYGYPAPSFPDPDVSFTFFME